MKSLKDQNEVLLAFVLFSGVGTYADIPDWSGQSSGQNHIINVLIVPMPIKDALE